MVTTRSGGGGRPKSPPSTDRGTKNGRKSMDVAQDEPVDTPVTVTDPTCGTEGQSDVVQKEEKIETDSLPRDELRVDATLGRPEESNEVVMIEEVTEVKEVVMTEEEVVKNERKRTRDDVLEEPGKNVKVLKVEAETVVSEEVANSLIPVDDEGQNNPKTEVKFVEDVVISVTEQEVVTVLLKEVQVDADVSVEGEQIEEVKGSTSEGIVYTDASVKEEVKGSTSEGIVYTDASVKEEQVEAKLNQEVEVEGAVGTLVGTNETAKDTEVANKVVGTDCVKEEDSVDAELDQHDNVEQGTLIGDNESGKVKKLKKRKIAMVVAYCGAQYQGMQRNPGAITIEGELEEALYRAGAITKDNFGVPRKIDWMRAARTDKGVSAIGQIVSGQFIIEPEGFVERVNSFLPKDIRLLGYKRVTATFNAKKLCDKRRYEYVLPTYCFDHTKHLDREAVNAEKVEKAAEMKSEGEDEGITRGEKVGVDPMDVSDGHTVENTYASGENGIGPRSEDTSTGEVLALAPSSPKGDMNCATGETSLPSVESLGYEEGVVETMANEDTEKVKSSSSECLKVLEIANAGQGTDSSCGEKVTNEQDSESGRTKGEATSMDASPRVDTAKTVYKFDESELNRLNRILAKYKGTHNFHNFTARTTAEDPSALRYIMSFEADDTFESGGLEFVRLHVIGQSFMLHQIRKMVGLAVAIMRGAVSVDAMDYALRKDTKFNVPMAPELGLFLEECYYSSYNKRFQASHEEVSLKDYDDSVKDFKKSVIYPHISTTETRDQVFPLWLHGINDRHFPNFVAVREGSYKPGNRVVAPVV